MYIIQRSDRGSSIAAFVIVGAVLVLGLVGLSYTVKQRGIQARKEQAIAASQEKEANNESSEVEVVASSDEVNSEVVVESGSFYNTAESSVDIPATGMEFDIVKTLGAGLLVMLFISYIMSRQRLIGRL